MPLDYEYYGKYDPGASDEVDFESQVRNWFWTMNLMFEFVKDEKNEIFDAFIEMVADRYRSELISSSHDLSRVGLDRILIDQSVFDSYETIKELGLQLIMKYIPFREGYILSTEKETMSWVDHYRARHMLLYYCLTSLVELLGRESGLAFYKDFVEHWGRELEKRGKSLMTLAEGREKWVKSWAEGGLMEFGVYDYDEHMFLAKFDRCFHHEAMKHVEDQELAYYVVCYPGQIIHSYTMENARLRRSVTVFTGDFCDELRWDPRYHDEPEQPSHEFSRRLIPK